MLPHMRGAADPGADVGFSANTSRKSAHLGTSACSQELYYNSVLEVRNSACLRAGGAVDQGRHSKKKGSNFSEP